MVCGEILGKGIIEHHVGAYMRYQEDVGNPNLYTKDPVQGLGPPKSAS